MHAQAIAPYSSHPYAHGRHFTWCWHLLSAAMRRNVCYVLPVAPGALRVQFVAIRPSLLIPSTRDQQIAL